MPTYILHGGEASTDTPTNTAFWRYMAEALPAGGTWLGCYFARFTELSEAKYLRDAEKIRSLAPNGATCVMAHADEFEAQLQAAHVLYIAGGNTLGLANNLKNWPDVKRHIANIPVVAGSSAGANILGQTFLTKRGEHGHGLGLIPYNLQVHHTAQGYHHAHAANPLPPPVLALHETQFCIIRT